MIQYKAKTNQKKKKTVKHITGLIHAHTLTEQTLLTTANPQADKSQFSNQLSDNHAYK